MPRSAESGIVGRGAGLRAGLVVGCLILAALAAAAAAGDRLCAWSPTRMELSEGLHGPGAAHLLGQDKLGRDVLARLLGGARVSLAVSVAAVVVSVSIGVVVGATAGFFGGAADFLLMRVVDVLLAFPGLLLAIALAAAMGPGLGNVVLALTVIGWTGYARLVRAEVLALRQREHVEAAVALGVPPLTVLTRHVLPLTLAPLLVQASFGMAAAVVAEASLSFLGLGIQPPAPSWGSMLAEGRSFLIEAPHLVLAPAAAITLMVLALNLIGDGLRDRFDLRSQ